MVASIRPERLTLAPARGADFPWNFWQGRISEIIFIGDATKYRVALEGLTLTVKTQDRDLAARARVGDEVGVRWSPAHTALLDQASDR